MLYNGHLVIADTFSRNRPNHGQTLIGKPLYSGHFYSGHLLQRTFGHFGQNFPLTANTLWLVGKKENTCMFLFDTFTLTWSSLSNFSKLIFTHVITCISIKNSLQVFESQSNTTFDFLSSHFYTDVMICKLKKFWAIDSNRWKWE